jgi:hypothetical protein
LTCIVEQARQIPLDIDDLVDVLVPALAIFVLFVFVEAQSDPGLEHRIVPVENETSGKRARVQGGQGRWIEG